MSRDARPLLACSAVSAVAGLVMGYLFGRAAPPADPLARKVQEASRLVREEYFGELDPAKLQDRTLLGMMSALDPYSTYYSAEEWAQLEEPFVEGAFGGVGIQVQQAENGYLLIVTPIEGTPAMDADILPGDYVTEVDGESIRNWPLERVIRRIRGEPGTSVRLTIWRGEDRTHEVSLTRAVIRLNPVRWKLLEHGIGYIRISEFNGGLREPFLAAVEKLRTQGMRALVIDMRFNTGGLLEEAVFLCDQFLREGVIVRTEGRRETERREYLAKPGDPLEEIPLGVLINEGTVSAAEVFAGCIQDHKRGILVGERSFGKGLVQQAFRLDDNSRIRITTARYLTPAGRWLDRTRDRAIDPDTTVEMTPEDEVNLMRAWSREGIVKGEPVGKPPAAGFTDRQLEEAVRQLRRTLDGR